MIGLIAAALLKRGLFNGSEAVARRAAWALLLLAALLAIGVGGVLWMRAHDAAVVEREALERKAAEAERTLRAERAAGEAAGSEADVFGASQADVKEARDEAVRKDPEGAARPVGPGMQSYFDSLRKQGGPGQAERQSPDVRGRAGDPGSGAGRSDKR